MRVLLLLVVTGGLAAVCADLLLLGHYKDSNQLVPLTVSGAALLSIAWTALRPSVVALRALQFVMLCCMGTGIIGITLHGKGGVEHQREVDPALAGRDLFWKVVAAPDPPVLSPGIMVQLGLLGLLYTYRHPELREN